MRSSWMFHFSVIFYSYLLASHQFYLDNYTCPITLLANLIILSSFNACTDQLVSPVSFRVAHWQSRLWRVQERQGKRQHMVQKPQWHFFHETPFSRNTLFDTCLLFRPIFAGEEKTTGTQIRRFTRGHVHIALSNGRDSFLHSLQHSPKTGKKTNILPQSGQQKTQEHSFRICSM